MEPPDGMTSSVKILSIILLSFIACCMLLCCIGYLIHRKQMRQRKRSQVNPELEIPGSIFAIQIPEGPVVGVDNINLYNPYALEKPPPSYESISRSGSVSSQLVPPAQTTLSSALNQ